MEVGIVARMVEIRNTYSILLGNLEVKTYRGDLNVDVMIILKCIFKEEDGRL
jgi:hypothetical protein